MPSVTAYTSLWFWNVRRLLRLLYRLSFCFCFSYLCKASTIANFRRFEFICNTDLKICIFHINSREEIVFHNISNWTVYMVKEVTSLCDHTYRLTGCKNDFPRASNFTIYFWNTEDWSLTTWKMYSVALNILKVQRSLKLAVLFPFCAHLSTFCASMLLEKEIPDIYSVQNGCFKHSMTVVGSEHFGRDRSSVLFREILLNLRTGKYLFIVSRRYVEPAQ